MKGTYVLAPETPTISNFKYDEKNSEWAQIFRTSWKKTKYADGYQVWYWEKGAWVGSEAYVSKKFTKKCSLELGYQDYFYFKAKVYSKWSNVVKGKSW